MNSQSHPLTPGLPVGSRQARAAMGHRSTLPHGGILMEWRMEWLLLGSVGGAERREELRQG